MRHLFPKKQGWPRKIGIGAWQQVKYGNKSKQEGSISTNQIYAGKGSGHGGW